MYYNFSDKKGYKELIDLYNKNKTNSNGSNRNLKMVIGSPVIGSPIKVSYNKQSN